MAREKTVFDRGEVAHVWASQSKEAGRAKSTKLSFYGPKLYSYSTVIGRIGKHRGREYVLLNTHGFGPTTAKHQGDARHATTHMKQFFGDWGSYNTEMLLTPRDVVKQYEDDGDEQAKETHKQKRMMYQIFSSAITKYGRALDAAEFFGFGTAKIKAKIKKCHEKMEPYREAYESWEEKHTESVERARETKRRNWEIRQAGDLEQRRLSIEAFLADHTVEDVPSEWIIPPELKEVYRAQKKKREAWESERAKEYLEMWSRGEDPDEYVSFHSLPVRLRVRPCDAPEPTASHARKDIETSHGAVIPYEDGRRAFRFIQRHKGKAWRRNGEQCPVGHYQIDAITEDGSIVAGCHRIDHEEIMRFAQAEGWLQLTEGPTDPEEARNQARRDDPR